MAEASTKPRKRRRNLAKELTDLRAYCEAHIEVLKELTTDNAEYRSGKMIAFQQVLAKLDGAK